MPDQAVIDAALSTGVSIAGGGGLVGVLVRFLMGGVSKRLDAIDAHLKDSRKDLSELTKAVNSKHESLLERVVKAESSLKATHNRLDALVAPSPNRRSKRKRS